MTERTTSCSLPMLNYWLHTRKALTMGFVLSDGQAHQNLRKYSWEKRNWCQWVSTAATSCSPEISSWSTWLSCLNVVQQKERLADSRRHLLSETQQNFLCRWGYHVSQILGKHVDVVRVSTQKISGYFPPWKLGCWEVAALFRRKTLKKLSLFHCFMFHSSLFDTAVVAKNCDIPVSVSIHICLSIFMCKEVYSWTEHWGEVLTTLKKMGILLLMPMRSWVNQNPETLIKVEIFCKQILYYYFNIVF